MGHCIIKLIDKKDNQEYYLEWSSVVDAPITYGLSLEEFKAYYKDEYGRSGMSGLDNELKRVDEKGTSAFGYTVDRVLAGNHAGDNEEELTKEQIIEKYCRQRPMAEEE